LGLLFTGLLRTISDRAGGGAIATAQLNTPPTARYNSGGKDCEERFILGKHRTMPKPGLVKIKCGALPPLP